MTLPPWIVSLLLAAIASVSVPLVYALTKATLDKDEGGSRGFRIFVAAISAAGALSSPIFLSEVGTTFNDYCGAVIILFALWLVARDDAVARAYVVAGALFGIAVSLKLTNAVFVFGWAAAIVAIETKQAVRGLLNSAIGFLASYLPIGGIWNAYVYSLFKNPLFPLYNHLFKSDAYAHVPMLDTRFKARSFSAALEYLPKLALGEPTTTELAFRDIRFLVVALLLALALPRVLELRFASGEGAAPTIFNRKRSLFVLFFTMISLAAWLGLFGVERYAVLLEQLAPLVFLILLSFCAEAGAFSPRRARWEFFSSPPHRSPPIGDTRRCRTTGTQSPRPRICAKMGSFSSCSPASRQPMSSPICRRRIPLSVSKAICRSILTWGSVRPPKPGLTPIRARSALLRPQTFRSTNPNSGWRILALLCVEKTVCTSTQRRDG